MALVDPEPGILPAEMLFTHPSLPKLTHRVRLARFRPDVGTVTEPLTEPPLHFPITELEELHDVDIAPLSAIRDVRENTPIEPNCESATVKLVDPVAGWFLPTTLLTSPP